MNDTIDVNSDTIAKTCVLCNKSYQAKSSKSRYCSEACKQKAKRLKELENENIGEAKTEVDKEFAHSKPGFYKFSDTIRTVRCLVCNKEFKTSLNLLRSCSVAHRDELIRNLTGNV